MPMQEKAVGDNADLCCRPMPPNHDDEFRQTGMNGRFAAEKIEFVHQKPIAPCFHPAIRVRQVQIAAVPVIGIVTAAVTGQIAGVGHMQFQAIDSPARPGWFGPPKPQDTGHGRKKIHDKQEAQFKIRPLDQRPNKKFITASEAGIEGLPEFSTATVRAGRRTPIRRKTRMATDLFDVSLSI
jgi:hypothetical protein